MSATIVSGGMHTAAILPVKRLELAKHRLSESLAAPLRARLARAMIGDVLHALELCSSVERTIVVTNEPEVAASARRAGSLVLADSVEDGQSAAVAIGVASALEHGFERVLCVPGDCPTLDPREIQQLLDRRQAPGARRASVVIVPDRHGTGTNGLLLSPPDAITPSFGPGSFERHVALAAASGADCQVARHESLLLDVDTGADLRALRASLDACAPRASRTRAVLSEQPSPAAPCAVTA